VNYLPFNSKDHDRVYKAEDWAWYFSTFIKNGVFPNTQNDGLQVVAGDGMQITVKPGFGYINGYAFRNEQDYAITLETADGALNRYDRVILRWDLSAREMYLAVLKGTASASPTAKAITRSNETYDLVLADVYVGKGVLSIQTANITDQRYNSSLCGIVAGTIEQIDASALTQQFNDFFTSYSKQVLTEYSNYLSSIAVDERAAADALEEYKEQLEEYQTEQQAGFESWVATLKDILTAEAAGNLQTEIEELQNTVDELQKELVERTSITTEAWLGACYLGGAYLVS
jgi:hypothetical protein